ncbi:NAD-dependent epimerase/dehydratase family protein [Paradevosia shaoguanensis]|uniref:NAD-dependent epimerase/dehydratase family protein n=1 Tax=Paradevosia shaoguanensis TaxID=1335043 RepID=UPI000505A0BB|nr:UDP-glucuronate 5-epimerase [Devosia sp. 17-2-E-8]
MRFFVTGTAGFIGFHLARRLLQDGHDVFGFDGMTPYYDVRLKLARNAILAEFPAYQFTEAMLEDRSTLDGALAVARPDIVVHLAAQAGVRYSLEHPESYLSSNLVGTFNLLDAAKHVRPRHVLVASSSSVYGGNTKLPFAEIDRTDFPVSLYAASKRATEAMAHSAAHLANMPTTCFRFFTVYGPWGRPDMALYKFVDAIEAGRPIDIYGQGRMRRDATDVGDLVEAIVRLADAVPASGQSAGEFDSISPVAPWRAVNIAGGRQVELMTLVETIERAVGRVAEKVMLPMQPGDAVETYADNRLLRALTGYVPSRPIAETVADFVAWYRDYRASTAGSTANSA